MRQFMTLKHGIPSHDTFSRVFRLLDPAAFAACFTRFMHRFADTLQGVVAIDGKTLRRSFDRAAGQSPLHMLHAWSVDQRLLLGQLAVDEKSNEITAVPKLLELLSLKGCIVTTDALNCQRAIAAKVVEQGADYVLALKGNQGSLHDDVRRFLADPQRLERFNEGKTQASRMERRIPDQTPRQLRLHSNAIALPATVIPPRVAALACRLPSGWSPQSLSCHSVLSVSWLPGIQYTGMPAWKTGAMNRPGFVGGSKP